MNRLNILVEDSGRALHTVSDSSFLPSISAGRKSDINVVRSAVLTNGVVCAWTRTLQTFLQFHLLGASYQWALPDLVFFWKSCARSSSSLNHQCCDADFLFSRPSSWPLWIITSCSPSFLYLWFMTLKKCSHVSSLKCCVWASHLLQQPWALQHMHAGQHAAAWTERLVILQRGDGAN